MFLSTEDLPSLENVHSENPAFHTPKENAFATPLNEPIFHISLYLSVQRMETCFDEIRLWMSQNHLKLNDDKTEFIIIGSNPQRAKVFVPHIRVGDANIVPSTSVRNLGVIFDSYMSMDDHISKAAKSARISLRNIGRVRKHLNKDTSELLVHAFVSSRLDMGNSMLYGVTNLQLSLLQRIQNMAARIVTLTKTREHITPVLFDLHWLPVRQRTMYKLGLFLYKILKPQSHYP